MQSDISSDVQGAYEHQEPSTTAFTDLDCCVYPQFEAVPGCH